MRPSHVAERGSATPDSRLQPPGTRQPSELYRGLGRLDVVALTLNNVVGAGIFAMPAALAAAAGNLSILVLAVAFLLVLIMALCTVEVASRYDATGGPMYYASAAFGHSTGFVVGWLMYLSRLAAFGAIAAIMLDYAAGLWPVLGGRVARALTVTLFVGVLTVINLRGVVHGAHVTNLFALAKGLPLISLALVGLWLHGWTELPPARPHELQDLSRALLIAFFACMGFEQSAVIAGEVRNPRRDLPAGMIGGAVIVGVLYVLLMFACFATVPDLARSTRPLADAAAALVGPLGATAMAVTAAVSCAGSLSGSMIVTPRVLYAIAAQGDLPRVVMRVEPVRLTPAVAILITALLVWLLTVSGTFVYLATFSVLARMLMYGSTCAALIPLRRRHGPAPITIPFGPMLAVLALLSCVVVLVTTTGVAVRDLTIAVAVGWIVRAVARSRRSATRPVPQTKGNADSAD